MKNKLLHYYMTQLNVGIITVPLSPGKKYFKVCGDGYIASSHINWLERAGISIIAIPYDTIRYNGTLIE